MASLSDALEAVLAAGEPATGDAAAPLLIAESAAEAFEGLRVSAVPNDRLVRSFRELGSRAALLACGALPANLLRNLQDQPPALLVLTAPAEAYEAETLEELRRLGSGRRPMALLGPGAKLRLRPGRAEELLVLAAPGGRELDALEAAMTRGADPRQDARPAVLAVAPTPGWLPTWLRARPGPGSRQAPARALGYVPAAALDPSWIDWLQTLPPEAQLRQLLIPLGVPAVELEPRAEALEAAMVAHQLERFVGPSYPAPGVLALLRDALDHDLDHAADAPQSPDADARALWAQARRALPRVGELVGMAAPDPALSLRIPTAAFLAQRGLLRARASQALLQRDTSDLPARPNPELVERADAVLEGAGEVLSDQESKVVLRGHGIEVTRQAFATSASGAASFADKIGYPVALKALSPDLRRKAEVGAVVLDVVNAAAAKRAYSEIVTNVEERAPLARLDGVVVAEMIEAGLDLRCGALRTRSGSVALYAHAVLASPVEPLLARSPLSPTDALLFAEAVLAAIPVPARRRASDPDVTVLARLLLAIDGLMQHTGERLLAVDLDPVRLLPEPAEGAREYVTLDARIVQRAHLDGL